MDYIYTIFPPSDTTDVQMPTARVTANSVVVTCKFISGSRSRGCHVKLIANNFILGSYNISRDAGVDFVAKEFTVNYPKDLNIEVFDWEADGNLGSLALSVGVQVVPALSTEALPRNSSKKSNFIALFVQRKFPTPSPPLPPPILCVIKRAKYL